MESSSSQISNPNAYKQYEPMAKAEFEDDITSAEFLFSLFPSATEEHFDKFRHFLAGVYHNGIELGLILSQDPIADFDKYVFGIQEGYDKALEDIHKLGRDK